MRCTDTSRTTTTCRKRSRRSFSLLRRPCAMPPTRPSAPPICGSLRPSSRLPPTVPAALRLPTLCTSATAKFSCRSAPCSSCRAGSIYHRPGARSALVDRCAVLAPADFASRSFFCKATPLDPPRVGSAFPPRPPPLHLRDGYDATVRLPRVAHRVPPSVGFPLSPPSSASTPLHVLADPKILVPLSALLVPQSALAALKTRARSEAPHGRLRRAGCAPGAHSRRCAISARTHAAPRSPYCPRDPIRLRLASCTSATTSTRSSAPDTPGTIRTTPHPPPAPCVSATPTARSSPLIGASLARLAAPLLLPASHCPRHPPLSASVLAGYRVQGRSARMYLVPRGGTRLRSASRTPRTTRRAGCPRVWCCPVPARTHDAYSDQPHTRHHASGPHPPPAFSPPPPLHLCEVTMPP
ncbi:hypothetical protein B0H14DRAFT_1336131 [Mycena olivaceomarginata]|nr:hypothetical protein B0H14DRAFT_1336131 [Mycena olivaceomarginata]